MENRELTQLIAEVISSKGVRDRGGAACQIIKSKNIQAFIKMLDEMQKINSTEFDDGVLDLTIDVLIDHLLIFLPILTKYVNDFPNTQVGRSCIYLLGEISYKQCLYKTSEHPDKSILLTLVNLLKRRALLDDDTLSIVIASLKSYAHYGDATDAKLELTKFLRACHNSLTQEGCNYSRLSEIIDILAKINKSDKITELRVELHQPTIPDWLSTHVAAEIHELENP